MIYAYETMEELVKDQLDLIEFTMKYCISQDRSLIDLGDATALLVAFQNRKTQCAERSLANVEVTESSEKEQKNTEETELAHEHNGAEQNFKEDQLPLEL